MHPSPTSESLTVHLTALGSPVVIEASGSRATELVQAIEKAWEWCLAKPPADHSASEPVVVRAFLDSDLDEVGAARASGVLASPSLPEVMHWLTPTVTTQAITQAAGSLLMVHACAVADPATGAAVVLVGPSGMGKTTAAMALGAHFGYLTDESAGIRDDLSVVAYPKPLSVLHRKGAALKDQLAPCELGLLPPPENPQLAAVLLLDRRKRGPRTPVLEPVPTVRALAALSPQVSFLGSRPEPLKRMASMLKSVGGLRQVSYREAADLVPVVRDLVGGAS